MLDHRRERRPAARGALASPTAEPTTDALSLGQPPGVPPLSSETTAESVVFAALLQRHRLAAGLSQAELAGAGRAAGGRRRAGQP